MKAACAKICEMVPIDELEDFGSKSRTRKLIAIGVVGAVAAAALGYGLLQPAPDRSSAGRAAPDFELPLLTSEGTLSSEELKGSPVVVNFFASWCAPCREEAPLLQQTWEEYRDQGVTFIGVSIRDAASDAEDFIQEFGITYPVVHDPAEALAAKIGVRGLPETYFIDEEWRFAGASSGKRIANRQGTVWFGPISEEELKRALDRMLAGGS